MTNRMALLERGILTRVLASVIMRQPVEFRTDLREMNKCSRCSKCSLLLSNGGTYLAAGGMRVDTGRMDSDGVADVQLVAVI